MQMNSISATFIGLTVNMLPLWGQAVYAPLRIALNILSSDCPRDKTDVEDCMRIYISGSMAHLKGDWTVTGVTQCNLDTLAFALQQIKPTCARRLQIDCRQVHAIDTTGQQILNVWVECAKLRGVEPELVNLPDNLRQSFQSLGLRCRYTSRNGSLLNHATSNHRKRRFPHDNRRDKGNCQETSH